MLLDESVQTTVMVAVREIDRHAPEITVTAALSTSTTTNDKMSTYMVRMSSNDDNCVYSDRLKRHRRQSAKDIAKNVSNYVDDVCIWINRYWLYSVEKNEVWTRQ
jgi:hypothetical protein